MTTSLDYLRQTGTILVCDSGDFECECGFNIFNLISILIPVVHICILVSIQLSVTTTLRLP